MAHMWKSAPPPTFLGVTSPGAILAGRYCVRRLIGQGGMGNVYEAAEEGSGRVVAVKCMHPYLTTDAVAVARFEREARAAAASRHPHVIEIYDAGLDGDTPFLVMEYVAGESAADRIHRVGALSIADACGIAVQVLEALEAVHAGGVVHRDLKPENVLLLDRDGRDYVKVVDFGVAVLIESALDAAAQSDLTPAGRVMGTPHYTSPEQLAGGRAPNPRSDVYSVGVLLFELLAGARPFESPSVIELCQKILEEAAPPMRAFRKDVPEELEAVIRRALAKHPAHRYGSALEMRLALQAITVMADD